MRALLYWFTANVLFSCVAVSPSLRMTPREEAVAHLSRGEGALAIPLLKSLLAAAPTDLGLCRMWAEAHVKAGTTDSLLQTLRPLDTAVSHYQQGLVLFALADAPAAISQFRRAAEQAPEQLEFQHRLGVALLESERFEDAATVLEKLASQPHVDPHWMLPVAKARYRFGRSAHAVEALRVVVLNNPSPADVGTARSLMELISDPFGDLPRAARTRVEQAMQWLEAVDVPQQAIGQLEELLSEYPHQAVLHALLGLAWARLDEPGRAVDELQRAIELAPNDGKNHLYLADFYLTHQRPKLAAEHYSRATQLNPLLERAWLALGDGSLEKGDLLGARTSFAVATHLAPQNLPAKGKLALVFQLESNWPAAERELRAALEVDPENLEFMLRLGVLHAEHFTHARAPDERKRASDEATVWLNRVLAAQPENALASRALERLAQH